MPSDGHNLFFFKYTNKPDKQTWRQTLNSVYDHTAPGAFTTNPDSMYDLFKQFYEKLYAPLNTLDSNVIMDFLQKLPFSKLTEGAVKFLSNTIIEEDIFKVIKHHKQGKLPRLTACYFRKFQDIFLPETFL